MITIPPTHPHSNPSGFNQIHPYGDHLNDGITQVSFTLPLPDTKKARQAALILVAKMGLENAEVIHAEPLTPDYTSFILYGKNIHSVDLTALAWEDDTQNLMAQAELEIFIEKHLTREIVVVGASTGTDTHTIGIDAILNMKGFDGQPGLEAYRGFRIYNLGGQIPNETLVAKARLDYIK